MKRLIDAVWLAFMAQSITQAAAQTAGNARYSLFNSTIYQHVHHLSLSCSVQGIYLLP